MNHTNDGKRSPHMSSNCPQIIKEQPLPTTHFRCWGSAARVSRDPTRPRAPCRPLDREAHSRAQCISHQGLDCGVETTAAALASCPT